MPENLILNAVGEVIGPVDRGLGELGLVAGRSGSFENFFPEIGRGGVLSLSLSPPFVGPLFGNFCK